MILHHYPNSPFAEKIRAIFGYKQLKWQSVIAPDIMPKPDLQALTGGYRRIPVLQIGADVYCDTALIVQVIESAHPDKSLFSAEHAALGATVAQWADDALFWAAMGHNFKGAAALFAGLPPEQAALAGKAFADDRAAMFGTMQRLRPHDATGAYKLYLARIEAMLGETPYLFGNAPSLADFSCYHPLWFTLTRVPQMAGVFDATPRLRRWLDAMQSFSKAAVAMRTDCTAAQALSIAAQAEPLAVSGLDFCDEHGIALGEMVAVTAEKFGLEPSVGELLAATQDRFILRRHDATAGWVHAHFPRLGFALKRA